MRKVIICIGLLYILFFQKAYALFPPYYCPSASNYAGPNANYNNKCNPVGCTTGACYNDPGSSGLPVCCYAPNQCMKANGGWSATGQGAYYNCTTQSQCTTQGGYQYASLSCTDNTGQGGTCCGPQPTPTTGYSPVGCFGPGSNPLTNTPAPGFPTATPTPLTYSLSGTVFEDKNNNGNADSGEAPLTSIVISNGVSTTTSDNNGYFHFTNLPSNTYTISITTPGYHQTTTNIYSLGPSKSGIFVGAYKSHSISGGIYIDKNGGDATTSYDTINVDAPFAGSSGTITFLSQPDGAKPQVQRDTSAGTYTITNLLSGTYTLQFTASGYTNVYPALGQATVTIGEPSCSPGTPPYHATDQVSNGLLTNQTTTFCDSNNDIHDLYFGVTNQVSWLQGICTDLREDSGFVDWLPNTGTCDGTHSNAYAILPGHLCTNGGIVYSGDKDADFGPNGGQASIENWVVGGNLNPSTFHPNNSTLRNSYEYLLDTARMNNTPLIDLAAYCDTSDCHLPADLASGIYTVTGDLSLVGLYTFPESSHYAFLISGKLIIISDDPLIPETLLIPDGSTAIFASKGDILIDPSVGEIDYHSYDATLEGVYMSDGSIILEANQTGTTCSSDGTPIDKRVNLVGSFVAKTIQNNRDLCTGDLFCPTYTISHDIGNVSGTRLGAGSGLGYLLYTPPFLKHHNFLWQEIPAVGN